MPTDPCMLPSAPNFRDLGDLPAAGGRVVAPGRVYRSEVLSRLDEADRARLRALNIGAVCDLRHGVERERQRNRWPEGQAVQVLDMPPTEGLQAVQADGLLQRLTQPDFDADEVRAVLIAGYRRMPQALGGALRAVFAHLLQDDAAPLLIHCTSGKDRSGFVSAVLLAALEVPRERIVADYLLSRERYPVEPMRQMLSRALGEGLPTGRLEQLLDLASVHADYLDAAFDEIDTAHDGLAAYLRDAAGLDAGDRARLQRQLLIG